MDTWMIKPDVSAPGVNIVSTIPTHDPADPYGYGSKQGTIMILMLPAPCALCGYTSPSASVKVSAVFMRAAFICSGLHFGLACLMTAAAPATCGEAMLVPCFDPA
jgi:hypothetical protein